ncbi:PGPGW domain-containing protein [Azospirillum halopraeferens]|uniref:PGPGW domain-containing protein n=1 Tax=Azospirillum halopraeferens TaxID=34010 RepID=UPI000406A793|nr:PGPGW domain-containing protein [Azospirillum halopraeferens]
MPRSAAAPRLTFARARTRLLVGLGWVIIAIGVIITPIPGPGGVPVAFVGGLLVLRHSPDSRRLFVRMKKRHPRFLAPFERIRTFFRRRRQRIAATGRARGFPAVVGQR